MNKLKLPLVILSIIMVIFTIQRVVVFMALPDYNEEEFIEALNNGEDVRGKTVGFQIKDIEENMMTGWTMTSQHDVLFINGVETDDQIGDIVTVEVRDTGLAFGTWIVTTRVK